MLLRGVQHVGGVVQHEVAGAGRHRARAVPRAVPAPAHQRGLQEGRLQRHLPGPEWLLKGSSETPITTV